MKKITLENITLAHNIKREIKRLNRDIDLKIIKGLPYKAEARRHRFLMSQFDRFYEPRGESWKSSFFRKTIQAFASFML
jgi:hypothetical protein